VTDGDVWVLIPIMALLIPIVAVISQSLTSMHKRVLEHREQMAMRTGGQDVNQTVLDEITKLRDELSRLRDTTTQYDLSIQHTLDDVQRRLSFVESRPSVGPSGTTNPQPVTEPDLLINRT
jgi:hypothetical protein